MGRLVLPSEMRKELNIKDDDFVNIEFKNKQIIITNAKPIKTRDEIKDFMKTITTDDDISKGMKYALEWVLREDER